MSWKRWILSVAALALASAIASAQTTTEVKKGTVISTWADQLVVKMDDGTTRQITVPAGFQFDHEGQKVGLADLKPGWELTAVIKTTKVPKVVQTTEVKNGIVVIVKGKTLTYRDDAGKNQQWTPPRRLQVHGRWPAPGRQGAEAEHEAQRRHRSHHDEHRRDDEDHHGRRQERREAGAPALRPPLRPPPRRLHRPPQRARALPRRAKRRQKPRLRPRPQLRPQRRPQRRNRHPHRHPRLPAT